MAMPENDTTWPPHPFDKAYDAMAGWDAWYAGDVQRLAKRYETINGTRNGWTGTGGLVGAAQRFFHGDVYRTSSTTRLHIPIAADLSRTSADLLFAESPSFQLPDDTKFSDTQDRLSLILGDAETTSELLEAAEIQSALGGVFIRLIWDTNAFEHVRITAVHCDGAIPEWTYGQCSGVVFWRVLSSPEKVVYRHLERHSKGQVEHALYEGTANDIGQRVPLTEHPDTEQFGMTADGNYATGVIPLPPGVTGPTFGYIPNIKPNPTWRLVPGLSPLGRSDYDQLEALFDAADEAYSSMVRELRLGKARAFVDQSLTQSAGRGRGSTFDQEGEIFTSLEGLGSLQGQQLIQPYQPELRIVQHRAVIEEITNTILRSAGYTSSSFGSDPLNNATATEVNSKRELSGRTRTKKIQYWKAALEPLAMTALQLEKALFGASFIDVSEPVKLNFPIRTEVDPLTMAQTLAALNAAVAISTEEKVRTRQPNWPKQQVDDEVKRIHDENAIAPAANPLTAGTVHDPFGTAQTPPPKLDGSANPADKANQANPVPAAVPGK